MAHKEQKDLRGMATGRRIHEKLATTPKFKSIKSKSPRELFSIATALAGVIRIMMHLVHL